MINSCQTTWISKILSFELSLPTSTPDVWLDIAHFEGMVSCVLVDYDLRESRASLSLSLSLSVDTNVVYR